MLSGYSTNSKVSDFCLWRKKQYAGDEGVFLEICGFTLGISLLLHQNATLTNHWHCEKLFKIHLASKTQSFLLANLNSLKYSPVFPGAFMTILNLMRIFWINYTRFLKYLMKNRMTALKNPQYGVILYVFLTATNSVNLRWLQSVAGDIPKLQKWWIFAYM